MTNSQSPDRAALADELERLKAEVDAASDVPTPFSGGDAEDALADCVERNLPTILTALRSPSPYSGAAATSKSDVPDEIAWLIELPQSARLGNPPTYWGHVEEGEGWTRDINEAFRFETRDIADMRGSDCGILEYEVIEHSWSTFNPPTLPRDAKRTFSQCATCWQPATCKKYGCREAPPSFKESGAAEYAPQKVIDGLREDSLAGPTGDHLQGEDLRSYLRGSDALKAEAAMRGISENEALDRLVEIAERARPAPSLPRDAAAKSETPTVERPIRERLAETSGPEDGGVTAGRDPHPIIGVIRDTFAALPSILPAHKR